MLITDEIDDFINEKTDEWFTNQDIGCNCPAGNPPCGFCVSGYNCTLGEFIHLALEYEYGSQFLEEVSELEKFKAEIIKQNLKRVLKILEEQHKRKTNNK